MRRTDPVEAEGVRSNSRDTLERALAAGSTDQRFYEGVAATFRLFTNALVEAGAEPFDSVGESFDPMIHEAVETVPSDKSPPGTITARCCGGGDSAANCFDLDTSMSPPGQMIARELHARSFGPRCRRGRRKLV